MLLWILHALCKNCKLKIEGNALLLKKIQLNEFGGEIVKRILFFIRENPSRYRKK